MSARDLLELYRSLSAKVFRRPPWSFGIFGPRFSRRSLSEALDQIIGDVTLGSEKLRTGLAIITKRRTTAAFGYYTTIRGVAFLRARRMAEMVWPIAIFQLPLPYSPA